MKNIFCTFMARISGKRPVNTVDLKNIKTDLYFPLVNTLYPLLLNLIIFDFLFNLLND